MSTTPPCAENEREPLLRSVNQTETRRRYAILRALRTFVAHNEGLLLVILGQLFIALMNATVKILSGVDPPVGPLQVILVRMGITYICSLAYILGTRMDNPILGPKGVRLLLFVRGITGFFGLFGAYFSLQYLSLSDATVLMFLSPLFTTVLGALFLREVFRISQGLAGVVSLIGVILIARPPSLFGNDTVADSPTQPMERMMAVGFVRAMLFDGYGTLSIFTTSVALAGVLGLSVGYVSVRAMGGRVHPLIVMAHYSIYSVLVATIGMIITQEPFVIPTRSEWFTLLIMMGIFGFTGQIFLTMGLQKEAVGRASIGFYTQIVFAIVFQRIYFHTPFSWLSILGTCLILLSASYAAMTKERASHRAEPRTCQMKP